jgi:hypothetical protein
MKLRRDVARLLAPHTLDPGTTMIVLRARARRRARLDGEYPFIAPRDLGGGVLLVGVVAVMALALCLVAFDWTW